MLFVNLHSLVRASAWLVCRVLLALIASTSAAQGAPVGFASLNGGTTGGAAGPTVVAATAADFQNFATQSGALHIQVVGTLNVGGVRVASDKTISGGAAKGAIIGSLQLSDVNNVIIRNLSISNPHGVGEGDAITLRNSENIWIDHNNIFDSPDGLVDIVRESDLVTVSWNKIFYTDGWAASHGHRFAMLIGNSDDATSDAGKLRVTVHDNYLGDHVQERMPRVRFGDIHFFNNYLNSPGSSYAVRAAVESEVLVEKNHFENIGDPYEKFSTSAGVGKIEARDNLLVSSGTPGDPGIDDVFDPPYAYTAIDASLVKDRLLAAAGIVDLSGDYNSDGIVNAADYIVWRKTGGSPEQYEAWRAKFGSATAPGGGGGVRSGTVPEAAASSMLIVGFLIGMLMPSRCLRVSGSFLQE